VFLTFWQESSLTLLVTLGVIKNRTYWSAEDIVIGISGLLSCFEMMLFGKLYHLNTLASQRSLLTIPSRHSFSARQGFLLSPVSSFGQTRFSRSLRLAQRLREIYSSSAPNFRRMVGMGRQGETTREGRISISENETTETNR